MRKETILKVRTELSRLQRSENLAVQKMIAALVSRYPDLRQGQNR
jgi:hypothetical protein